MTKCQIDNLTVECRSIKPTSPNAALPTDKTLFKSSEAAAKLGISKTTVHRLVKAGQLECVQLAPNSVYFTKQQLDEFIDRHRKRYNPKGIRD